MPWQVSEINSMRRYVHCSTEQSHVSVFLHLAANSVNVLTDHGGRLDLAKSCCVSGTYGRDFQSAFFFRDVPFLMTAEL